MTKRAIPTPAGLGHGIDQEAVWLGAALLRDHVVRLVEIDRIDLADLDEVFDLDGLGPLGLHRLKLLGRDDDILIGRDLVAFDGVLGRHFLAVGGTDHLALKAGVVLIVKHVEIHVLLTNRSEQLDGDGDQSE